MKEAINLALRLFIVTALAALVLALVNNATAPVIAQRQAEELDAALKVVYPDSEEFDNLPAQDLQDLAGESSAVQEVFLADDGGRVYRIVSKGGYGGDIEFLAGVKDGSIVGFSVLNHSETPGFGDAVESESFANGVIDTSLDQDEIKAGSQGTETEIAAISGATRSTNCVLRGLNDMMAVNQKLAQ